MTPEIVPDLVRLWRFSSRVFQTAELKWSWCAPLTGAFSILCARRSGPPVSTLVCVGLLLYREKQVEGRGGVRVQIANEKDKQSEMHAPPVLLAENKKSWTPIYSTMLNCSAGLNSFHSHRDDARKLLTASSTSPCRGKLRERT